MNRWFRMYDEALDDPKVQKLEPDDFKAWVNLLCLANRNGGRLPDLEAVAFALRRSLSGALAVVERLSSGGLIDRACGGASGWGYAPHGWDKRQYKSDGSTERVKRFRNGGKPLHETGPEADTEADTEQKDLIPIVPLPAQSDFQLVGSTREVDVIVADLRTINGKSSQSVADAIFEAHFWPNYPARRGAKEPARKAFLKALKLSNAADICDGAKCYRNARRGEDEQFTKHASTWLNARGWSDEVEAVAHLRMVRTALKGSEAT